MRRALPVSLALWICGCAVVASRGEYRIYRKLVLEDSPDEQVRLVHRHEREYPDGLLASKVARIRHRLDERMYMATRNEAGLVAYLRAFPDGGHATSAAARLDQARRIRLAREAAERAQEEADRRAALQAEQQRRRWFRGAFLGWVQILSRVSSWNSPMEAFLAANEEFSTVWRDEGTAPVCQGDVCTREFPHDYYIRRTAQTRIDRQASFLLRVHTTGGLVTRIDVLIKGQGFLAWRELEGQNDIVPDDPEQVADARERAKTALAEMIQTAFPGGAPADAAAEPPVGVLWAYARETLRIELLSAPEGAPEPPGDGLTFGYAPPPPPEPAPPARRRGPRSRP
ncbi:MAG: hypothetical protein HYY06_06870 [Deltaproteobacteria bacterium]|nr:hypothetical protein [Deltaproteobacteria bacterium]